MKQDTEQLKEHYELEVKLANRLKNSSFEERKTLYKEVYNELFSKITHHPQNYIKTSQQAQDAYVKPQMEYLERFLMQILYLWRLGKVIVLCLLKFQNL